MIDDKQSDGSGSWPVNIVERQFTKVKREHGWKRLLAVAVVGAEVSLIVVVIALVII